MELLDTISLTTAGTGLCASLYSLYVEKRLEKNSTYKPLCDISDTISCSKPFMSPYTKLLGISNAYLGILVYSCVIALILLGYKQLVFYGASNSCSFFSFYGLYFVYRN